MKLRTGDPWMPAADYGRSLRGLTINLLVEDVAATLQFQTRVLRTEVVYQDPDFEVVRGYDAEWMFHADHTYEHHPFATLVASSAPGGRGRGVELRLHGCDPDAAERAATELGYVVIGPARDKPHGLRESFIADSDGYVWVPDVPT